MQNTILNQKIGVAVLSLAIFIVPTVVFGASLIPCGQRTGSAPITVGGASYQTTNECGFNDLIILANIIIKFLMIDVAVPLAALGFMWVGGNLIVNQNKEGAWTAAKESFGNIGMGFCIMLGAFVLLKLVLFTFLSTEQINFMKFMLDVT